MDHIMDHIKKNLMIKLLMFVFTIVYVASPLDLPGPVDDLVMVMLNLVLQRKIKFPIRERPY